MALKRAILLVVTHGVALAIGFALGIYLLPILTAPPPPTAAEIGAVHASAKYKAEFRRGLKGSDPLHWGEGLVSITPQAVSFNGRMAPGPAYKLYLTPEFVETKQDFLRVKASSAQLGDVKTFESFIVPVPPTVDISAYNSVVVWCESFSMFITAAKYR